LAPASPAKTLKKFAIFALKGSEGIDKPIFLKYKL